MALTPRGYIKTVSGNKRMRWVRPPHSADDMALAQNLVVFDSANANAFGVYLTGIWTGSPPTSLTKIVSWASPGYVPLVTLQWSKSDTADAGNRIYSDLVTTNSNVNREFSATETGIWWLFGSVPDPDNYPTILRYIVHRMPA